MPDYCIQVIGYNPDPGGLSSIEFQATAVTGKTVTGQVLLNFTSSSSITNAAIIEAAKTALAAVGVIISLPDREMLFGGRVYANDRQTKEQSVVSGDPI